MSDIQLLLDVKSLTTIKNKKYRYISKTIFCWFLYSYLVHVYDNRNYFDNWHINTLFESSLVFNKVNAITLYLVKDSFCKPKSKLLLSTSCQI